MSDKNIKKSRAIFLKIKKDFENQEYQEQIKEFEKALEKLVKEYNTSCRENRFVVGHALEILFCALLKSIGLECKWLQETRYDIQINGVRFSLKSNFIGSGSIRLINVLGSKEVKWEEPTIFFITSRGICYLDPAMNLTTSFKGDALTVQVKEGHEPRILDKPLNQFLKVW